MAGSYPDVPGRRMAYDRDGTSVVDLYINGGTTSAVSAANIGAINDEDSSSYVAFDNAILGGHTVGLGFLFPEQRDLVAYHADTNSFISGSTPGAPLQLQWSNNTTNGIDGTWTNILTNWADDASSVVSMRDNVRTASASGATAVRFLFRMASGSGRTFEPRTFHLYGSPSSGAAPDRLLFYDPVSAAEVGGAYFDWGDIARGSSVSRDFRIHNPSSTLTANSVVVSIEALTDTSPSNTGQHEFSTNGGSTWATTASVGNLAPGSTSSTITVRRVTNTSAVLGLWWARLVASASSWL